MTEGPYKLPEGWRWVKLGEVCEIVMGQSPPSETYNQEGEGLPFFQGKSDFEELYPSPRVWCTAPLKIATEGDILISVRAPVGPTNLANIRCCIGRGLAALRVGNELESYWLLFYLRSIEELLATSGTGSTFNAITKKELVALPIPLPPLEEQRRIVARIEELMERIREASHLRQEAREDTERLWQATLFDVFPRPGTALPPGWRWVKLGEVITHMANGTTAKQNKESRGIPVTRMETIANERIDSQRVGFIENPTQLMVNKYRLLPGDILFSHINSDPHLGKTAIYDGVPPILLHGMNLLRITVNKHILESEFLNYVFKAYRNLEIFVSIAQRAIGQSSINQRKMRDLPIPLPSLEEQRRIVAQLEEVEEKVKSLKEGQAQVEAELQRLEQSILNAAFRGEL